MVQNEVDARARRERRQPFEQLDRFEQEVLGAVAPFRLQGEEGQDRLDEIRRLLRHAPPAATGADRAAFAGQRQEALERTAVAPDPQKAMDEQPAAEEAAELALDEAGQADPV